MARKRIDLESCSGLFSTYVSLLDFILRVESYSEIREPGEFGNEYFKDERWET
jgi:hypothetical protein